MGRLMIPSPIALSRSGRLSVMRARPRSISYWITSNFISSPLLVRGRHAAGALADRRDPRETIGKEGQQPTLDADDGASKLEIAALTALLGLVAALQISIAASG